MLKLGEEVGKVSEGLEVRVATSRENREHSDGA